MALLQKQYTAKASGLVISITLNDPQYSFHLIEIHCKEDPTCQFRYVSPSLHLTNTRIQYTSPRGYRIDGSLGIETTDAPAGGVQVRASLRFGSGSETKFTHLNDAVILTFDRPTGHAPSATPATPAPAPSHPHPSSHSRFGADLQPNVLPNADPFTDPGFDPAANPAADPDFDPNANAGTDAATDAATDPGTAPETDPETAPDAAQDGARASHAAFTRKMHEGRLEDLFPYIYLRKWSQPAGAALELAFVQFPATSANAVFYAALTAQPGLSREQMRSEALLFRSGSDKYAGLYVADFSQLQGVVSRLPAAAEAIRAHGATPASLLAAIPPLLYLHPSEVLSSLNAPDYVANIERIWQSYFAQLILEDDSHLPAQYTHLLLTDHVLRSLFAPTAKLTAADLAGARRASILLPKALFPLPPATAINSADNAAINICAIGELKMVRQALVRYEAGELAHVENIMPGEKREIRRTHASGRHLSDSEAHDSSTTQEQRADEARNSLVKQAQQAIAEQVSVNKYTDFDTSYGPPTQAKLNGSWTEWTKQGANPASDEQTEFARNILEQSVSRVTRNVHQVRESGSYARSEDSVTKTIDNSASQNKLLCAFRWLNKVFSASVVGNGHRLMIEIMLTQPAAGLRQRSLRNEDDAYERCPMPLSLPRNGIHSFADLTPDNYAALAAAYQVTNISPPPQALKYLSTTLCNAERKSLAVPPGYSVNQVFLTYIAEQPDADSPVILIGREKFKPGDDAAKARTFGENDTIALCVLGHAATTSPSPTPTPTPAPAPASTSSTSADDPAQAPVPVPATVPGAPEIVLANVVLACQPAATLFDEWRIKTYEALLRGYQHQLERARHEPRLAPPNARKQIRNQLRQACTRMLLTRAATLTGPADTSGVDAGVANLVDPWQMQFIDELFEWHQMNAHFYASSTDVTLQELTTHDETAYAEFMQADMARVLLPVAPSREASLLYYLSSGQRWQSEPALAPVDAINAALMLELKRMQASHRKEATGTTWEIVVPTTMQIQDEAFYVAPAQALAPAANQGSST